MPAALVVQNLNVSYNHTRVLEDVSFNVEVGDRVAIVGPNGAGKSTLIRAIIGLTPVESGRVQMEGGGRRPEVGYLTQRSNVDWSFPVTVFDVVMMGRIGKIGWLRWYGARDRELVWHSLEEVGMQEYAGRQISELSGGQQQRVFIARALAQEANILLMDEPFTGVDAPAQEVILQIMDELRTQHITILVSTHDLNLALARFDKVALLNHRLVAFGPAHEAITSDNLVAAYGGQAIRRGEEFVVIADDVSCCGQGEHQHG